MQKNILLIEPDETVAASLMQILKGGGFSVEAVRSEQSALPLLLSSSKDFSFVLIGNVSEAEFLGVTLNSLSFNQNFSKKPEPISVSLRNVDYNFSKLVDAQFAGNILQCSPERLPGFLSLVETILRLDRTSGTGRRQKPLITEELFGMVFSSKRILIVDDDSGIRSALKGLLGAQGYSIILAENAMQGLCKFKELNPDLVMADHLMGDNATGSEMALQMKKINPNTPIISLSGLNMPGEQTIGGSFACLLPKPFQGGPLLDAVFASLLRFPKKILLVDDERQILENHRIMLTLYGFECFTAQNGKEGLELFSKLLSNGIKIDLVLTDQNMPEMTGNRMACEIRGLSPRIKIVRMSALGDKLAPVFNESLSKPIRINALAETISRVFSGETDLMRGYLPAPLRPILVVGKPGALRDSIVPLLSFNGFYVQAVSNSDEAKALVDSQGFPFEGIVTARNGKIEVFAETGGASPMLKAMDLKDDITATARKIAQELDSARASRANRAVQKALPSSGSALAESCARLTQEERNVLDSLIISRQDLRHPLGRQTQAPRAETQSTGAGSPQKLKG